MHATHHIIIWFQSDLHCTRCPCGSSKAQQQKRGAAISASQSWANWIFITVRTRILKWEQVVFHKNKILTKELAILGELGSSSVHCGNNGKAIQLPWQRSLDLNIFSLSSSWSYWEINHIQRWSVLSSCLHHKKRLNIFPNAREVSSMVVIFQRETEDKLHCPSNKGFCRAKKLNPRAIFWTQAQCWWVLQAHKDKKEALLWYLHSSSSKNERKQPNGTVKKTERHFVLTAV